MTPRLNFAFFGFFFPIIRKFLASREGTLTFLSTRENAVELVHWYGSRNGSSPGPGSPVPEEKRIAGKLSLEPHRTRRFPESLQGYVLVLSGT